MTLWPAKNTGIMFGGVSDTDTSEETLESVFWNDLFVSRLVQIAIEFSQIGLAGMGTN
jgi:hypothetical protein